MAWTIKQNAARVVLLDAEKKIFLMKASDPLDPTIEPWWQIPGGGIDAGEDSKTAAARELYEEAGFSDIIMGPCIWTQYVEFTFGGINFKSNDFIHVATCSAVGGSEKDGMEWSPTKLEALEAAAFEEAKWWSLDELLENTEPVLPTRLREFLPTIAAGDYPSEPIDISPIDAN